MALRPLLSEAAAGGAASIAGSPAAGSRTVPREQLPRVAPLRLGGKTLQPRPDLRQSNPAKTKIIREWPWPSFFTADVSPLARVCRHGEIVPAGGSCARCQARSSSAPVAVEARRHAATAAHTGRCGRGSLPSSPAGRCGAPAAAGSSSPARRSTSGTRTETGRATTGSSTRSAIGARVGWDGAIGA